MGKSCLMDADVAIVGAGVAGSAAALEFLAQGLTVVLLEREDLTSRFESVPAGAVCRLESYGIAIGTPMDRVEACWGSSDSQTVYHLGARIVDRRALAGKLLERAQKHGARVVPTGPSLRLTRSSPWCLEWTDSHQSSATVCVRAPRLVDASGRRALIARSLGVRVMRADRLVALSVPVEVEGTAGTYTASSPDGWWNLCGNGKHGTLTLYSSPGTIRRSLTELSTAFKRTDLYQRTRMVGASTPVVRPCGSQRLSPCAGPNWISIGDAAWACQPLASAGVAKALHDATLVARGLAHSAEYVDFKRAQFEAYLGELMRHYSLERRWPASSFWAGFRDSADLHGMQLLNSPSRTYSPFGHVR
jgi:flavin-dependent dehydrogenase